MAGIFAISIDPNKYTENFLEDLFWGTFYQQHLGEEYSGLSTFNKGKIEIRTHRGLFRNTFSDDLAGLEGTEGVGYCGQTREPYLSESRLGQFSFCFTGNIVNLKKLVSRFKDFGHTFERGDDIEIIAKLVAQGKTVIEGLKIMSNEVKGAFSLFILSNEGIYAMRCPEGYWPLVIGEKEGAVAVASESTCFKNLNFYLVREVKPGEILLLKNGSWESKERIVSQKMNFCSFYWVYTAFPNDVFEGIPVSLVRKKLGALLAKRDIYQGFIPDIVAPVPDSGRFHAIGYHQEFCRQMNGGKIKKVPYYDELLLKYPYAGRSFLPLKKEKRIKEAEIKILPTGEIYQGKTVVICDDSIVRGTQIKTNLVPKLRALGIKEIHFRISNPELRSHCPWGKTTKKEELFASQYNSINERINFLEIDSLEYNTIKDLIEAIGLPSETICIDCDKN